VWGALIRFRLQIDKLRVTDLSFGTPQVKGRIELHATSAPVEMKLAVTSEGDNRGNLTD